MMCQCHAGLVWVTFRSGVPYSVAQYSVSTQLGCVPPGAFSTSAAQPRSTVAHSASPALVAAIKIKVDPDFFQGDGAFQHALTAFQWKLCTAQDPTVLTIAHV